MRLKCHFEIVDMKDEIVGVPVGATSSEIHGVIKLNSTGREIIDLLQNDTDIDSIIDVLSTHYDDCRQTIKMYVMEFVEKLRDYQLIED